MIGIRLSKQNGIYDMVFSNGVFEMATNGTAAACAVLSRLRLCREECQDSQIVNTRIRPQSGVDYYGIIFDAEKSRAEKELEYKRVILQTPGIRKILQFVWPQTDRSVTPEVIVQTDWSEETISGGIEPL